MSTADDPSFVLAIDLGSSGPKVSILSSRGELVASASGLTSTLLTADGGGEQDPEEWLRVVGDCVRQVVSKDLAPVERIVAVSCASQWSVTVPVDRAGRPLMNAVHWTDSRGAPYTKRVTDGRIKVAGYGLVKLLRWIRLTGGVPTHSGADALSHILFIRHERPEIYRDTYKLLEPMDFINFRLTGRAAATYATVYPYLLTDNRDNTRIDYDAGLIACCGLDREKLPDLVPVGTLLGTITPEMAKEWGLSPHTQIVAGTPDSQSAALGSGAIQDYAGHICVGTTAWMSCHVPFKKTNIFSYVATMPSAMHGRNMVMAEQGAASKCLQLFVEKWLCTVDALDDRGAPADIYARLEQLAASVPAGSDRLLFLPWLNGAGPPSGDSDIRGGFLNQSYHTGRAHAVRAIMEGVAMNLRWLRSHVERFIGRKFDHLNYIGGTARSDVWCQIMADVLELPIHRVVDPEMAISRGAAIVAWTALGNSTARTLTEQAPINRVFTPLPEHREIYRELFSQFENAAKHRWSRAKRRS